MASSNKGTLASLGPYLHCVFTLYNLQVGSLALRNPSVPQSMKRCKKGVAQDWGFWGDQGLGSLGL